MRKLSEKNKIIRQIIKGTSIEPIIAEHDKFMESFLKRLRQLDQGRKRKAESNKKNGKNGWF